MVNETYYKKWKSLRRIRISIDYVPIIVIILVFLLMYLTQSAGNELVLLVFHPFLLIFLCASFVYMLFPNIYLSRLNKDMLNVSKKASLYLIDMASLEAKKGDKVRTSLMIQELISSLHEYLKQRTFKLGGKQYTQSEILYINPSSISKFRILKYLQVNECLDELKGDLQKLQTVLRRNPEKDYIIIQNFILTKVHKIEEFSPSVKSPNKLQELLSAIQIPYYIAMGIIALYAVFNMVQKP